MSSILEMADRADSEDELLGGEAIIRTIAQIHDLSQYISSL